jgi:hypothetical protein
MGPETVFLVRKECLYNQGKFMIATTSEKPEISPNDSAADKATSREAPGRNFSPDVLRGAASCWSSCIIWACRISRGGWIGVDLFFVLSGFLISGLLFREWRSLGAIDIPRFYVRRGL